MVRVFDLVTCEGFESIADGRQFLLQGTAAEHQFTNGVSEPVPSLPAIYEAVVDIERGVDLGYQLSIAGTNSAREQELSPGFSGSRLVIRHSNVWMVDIIGPNGDFSTDRLIDVYAKYAPGSEWDYTNMYLGFSSGFAAENSAKRRDRVKSVPQRKIGFYTLNPMGIARTKDKTIRL